MYADRRRAFEARIGELFNDHKAAYPVRNMSNNAWRDLTARILSALEDSFQMGRRAANRPEPTKETVETGIAPCALCGGEKRVAVGRLVEPVDAAHGDLEPLPVLTVNLPADGKQPCPACNRAEYDALWGANG